MQTLRMSLEHPQTMEMNINCIGDGGGERERDVVAL